MTDAELIARLRWRRDSLDAKAADRIEALTKERDAYKGNADDNYSKWAASEAKLAKVVAAADKMLDAFCVHKDSHQSAAYEAMCVALAETEGESHD